MSSKKSELGHHCNFTFVLCKNLLSFPKMRKQSFWHKMSFKKPPQTTMGWLALLLAVFTIIVVLRVLLLTVSDPRHTAFMNADPLRPKAIEFVPLSQISRNLLRAVLVSEDDQFFEHSGFQWDSIKKAWKTNQKKQKRISGASTLSQQLARNLFLTRAKTWARKIKEAGYTVLLELFLSKERILELYLNVAEMGPGIYGVGQASRYHFGVKPQDLSQVQASLLAATLIHGKIYGKKPYPNRTLARQKKILYRMSHFALAIPDFVNKTPLVTAKDDEKTILSLIKGMTAQEADEPDDPVEDEADMMLVLPPQEKTPDAEEEKTQPDETEENKTPPVFLDEDN